MPLVEPIDLHHQGPRVIGVYLVETPDGLALVDCGPASTLETLRAGLRERGHELTDLRHLLLTHIHLDHAGATGTIVREHPGLQVHVSPIGAPHLIEPARLEASARRIYGKLFDPLWGELAPVPEENVRVAGDLLDAFPTPGHASHHVSYVHEGTVYTGDAAGVRIMPDRHVMPVSPPPDIDVEAWNASIDAIEARGAERLALIHFGVVDEPADHLARLREQLANWAERVRSGMSAEEFAAAGRADMAEDAGDADHYQRAAPFESSYAGLKRYWDKRAR